ncbi:MAG: succinyldiaminopimelate transaminase [Piscirickettsiaceae bacterium]|nr:succinyldiaminopimelate transaminase [Piscirickettsiaceae bacterium]
MNPNLVDLHPYPFKKLAKLKQGCATISEKEHISLSIGEPRHPTPNFITKELIKNLHELSTYPTTVGSHKLRKSIAEWLDQRFKLNGNIDASNQIIPVNSTREALFAFAQAAIDRNQQAPLVLMPNPFYQIYEGAAILAGAEPYFLNCEAKNNFIPEFGSITKEVWDRCQLIYLCNPSNPTGAIINKTTLTNLIKLAHQHNFIIASDECYSEIYFNDECPPIGLLQAAVEAGYENLGHCVVFHSLSKRSNAPGLRSGFVARDAKIIQKFLHYRTYHGCSMAPATQSASAIAWQDEIHVATNRMLYQKKFAAVLEILSPVMRVEWPHAGFYLWAKTPIADTEFTKRLFAEQNVTVLPGIYLARCTNNVNPGKNRVRIALVASFDECIDAAQRIGTFIKDLEN